MATTDTSAAIKAINDLYCDAESVLTVLAALGNRHAAWLRDNGHETAGSKPLQLMDDAQDALGEFADWQAVAA